MIDPYNGKTVLYEVRTSHKRSIFNIIFIHKVTYTRDWHFFEIIFFVILGLFGGLTGALFIRLNLKAQEWRIKMFHAANPVKEVMLLACATTFTFFLNGFTQIDSSELLEFLFRECTESDFNGLCRLIR